MVLGLLVHRIISQSERPDRLDCDELDTWHFLYRTDIAPQNSVISKEN